MLTTNDILALAPGPALDAAIDEHVFHVAPDSLAFSPAFSTDFAAGCLLLEKMPSLFVSRAEKPKDPGKPWIAGTLASDPSSTTWHTTLTVSGPTMLGVLCRAALLVALRSPPPADPVPDPKAGRAPVQPAKRAAKKRPNGAKVPVPTPIPEPMPAKATQRPVLPIRQPSIFLGARAKLPPLPKRKPFTMPGDPAK